VRRRRDRELAAVLAAANAAYGRPDERELAVLLALFNAPGPGPVGGAAPKARPSTSRAAASRPGWATGRLVVKCSAAFVLAAGCGVAAAGAGVLPNPVQQLAHDVLGGVGVPPPRTPGADGGTSSATASAPSGSASPSAAALAALTPLCEAVAQDGNAWRAALAKDEQATLVAAAGGEQKVVAYCARLLADSSTSTAIPSATASSGATATHGAGHATHSPSPKSHSTGH
jgi:hypothetical protein